MSVGVVKASACLGEAQKEEVKGARALSAQMKLSQ